MLFFGSIANWFRKRSRNIFHYHDGEKWRRADPYAIGQAFERDFPDYRDHFEALAEKESDTPVGPMRDQLAQRKKDAVTKIIAGARKIFDLKPLTETGGTTDAEAVRIATQFLLFMEDLAVAAGPFAD